MYGVKMVATVVMGRKCVHKIFAWTGNGAALPLPSRQTRGAIETASERAPGHIYGTTGFVSRPPDEDVVRTVTHFSGNGVPCTIFAFVSCLYIHNLPAAKSCVCKLYKENIVAHKSITSLIVEYDVHMKKKKDK